ncbi:MAG: tetratricopeptide repeat protein [Burkholderiales bacterium]|nr:tetratricopeptide repeat protein [Burkholderiales bacterium]
MHDSPGIATFLFTDIEGSSRLWETAPDRMGPALARHDAIIRGAVERHDGTVVKMLGDGVHAHFDDPLAAIGAIVEVQLALVDPASTGGFPLKIRSGIHAGAVTARDHDYYGSTVNRAARIMSSAHGGQILVSHAAADLVADRLPRDLELVDLGEVRLRDLTSPERLYQVAHPKLKRTFPALRSLEATPNNLPQQLTSLVGRERELAEVKRMLGTSRLLTLLGPGGIGKTRIALHVAAEVMDDHADGVWFVDLAPLADPQLVPQALASVLGVTEEAGRPVIEAVIKHLKDRRALVVLDNCEHLLHACAELASQLQRNAARVRVLAASRELLHVGGETSYPVPALSVPDATRALTPDALPHYESTRLFVERATAVQPAFRVTERNAGAIADICRRLDGIPLAIELAAARVRALPVEAIATRLSDRFRLLAGGDQTALPRQQTLRALIDWSYDLLNEAERALLRRLSVFAGGWTLEAAEAVASGGAIEREDVLDLQTHLVDKSLVALDTHGGRYRMLETVREYARSRLDEAGEADPKANVASDVQAARYGMLETVREYARERLDASGESATVHDRHLRYFLDLAEAARPGLIGAERGLWLANLDRERENLLAAHAWCDHAENGGEWGLRLSRAMGEYLFARGLLAVHRHVTTEALKRTGAQARTSWRARGLFDLGQIDCFMGRYAEAEVVLRESLDIARELDDERRIAEVLQPLAMAAYGTGDLARASEYLEQARDLARAMGDKRELAAALNGLAQVSRLQGRVAEAEPLYVDVVAIARETGDREILAIGLLNLSMVEIARGLAAPARDMLIEILDIAEETGSKPVGQSAFEVTAAYGALVEDWARAARFFGIAEGQIALTGYQRDPADEAFLKPFVERARVALGPPVFGDTQQAARALTYEQALGEVREWLRCG